ncbi:MAG: hypothetical protein A2527_08655 [Candidatus Lambdaproteobacteria bacterium RIFOXYD2_FULL_50_16]|uniref:1,4-dihydroxy-6-naphtoate synthase n=1 Tax=Candidatus Lambdaproteobacteria bacterium RIFOXYD2_FULL_50_16 TaxID=1817772 RepID=A0A1F6GAV1_9PROT|nr:MAG: hypothetical protein A2527_08655 [Candidatus Lambdaproteobacteria bacterium RIFOXYD2_FULL_50_16]
MQTLTLGFSPCPNDTFIFDALVHGRLGGDYRFETVIKDVEELNQMARQSLLQVSKASIHAFFHLQNRYQLLRSGAALGRGCGPLWIGKSGSKPKGGKVALPGAWTTASLLFKLANAGEFEPVQMVFSEIIPAILSGEVDSGVIIHESRFTYQNNGLNAYLDLGDWWEKETGKPIPLGGIMVRRDLAQSDKLAIEGLIADSIRYAKTHLSDARPYIEAHAQEMASEVIDQHIGLYVNDFSINLGTEGLEAIEELASRARLKGLIQEEKEELFV